MAQISYGTITITDTTDIERIYPVYCKGGETTAPALQPLSNWSEIVSQAGGNGDYIWQRIVTKKQDIVVTADDYSDAVRLTGDNGVSLTITSIQYAQTQNENDTPSYGNSMPSSINEGWWLWVKTTYSDGQSSVTKVKQGQKGDTGQRGTSILKVTTTPSVYTTIQGGFTPSYRMSLSTVKTESGKTEVLVGDIIEYNSNHYRVGYVSSSYVYLSAATSIKGADGQTYYTWIKYAPNDNPSNSEISDSPTGMTYIGIYTGTTTPAPSTASSYAPWMKYIGSDGGQGPQGISVTGTRELYWLKTTTNPSQITWNSSTSQPSQTIYSTDRQNSWTSVVPTYEANAIYYTCIETSLSNATKSWSTPVENKGLTSANQKALDAYNTSTARDTEVNALKAQAKHYWWDSQGAHVAAGENTTSVDNITQGTPSTYGFNALMAPGYLALKYKDINFAQLATNSLTFYRPATNGSTYVQGKKAMELTADALTFYKPLAYNSSNEPTAAAQLSSTGLNITDGTIQLGTSNSSSTNNGNITLSNTDFSRSINNISRDYLRLAIGSNFGVKNDGTLYANNAVISGTITVDSGSDLSAGLSDYSTTSQMNSAIGNASYSIEVKVTAIDYANSSATLVAVPYYQGSTTLPTLPNGASYSYRWYRGTTALSNTSTAPTISGATTATLELGQGSNLAATYVCVISKP